MLQVKRKLEYNALKQSEKSEGVFFVSWGPQLHSKTQTLELGKAIKMYIHYKNVDKNNILLNYITFFQV